MVNTKRRVLKHKNNFSATVEYLATRWHWLRFFIDSCSPGHCGSNDTTYVLMVPKFLDKKPTLEVMMFEDAPFSIYQLDPPFLRILGNFLLGTNGPKYNHQIALVLEIYYYIVK